MGHGARGGGHRLGRSETQRVAGLDARKRARTGKRGGRPPAPLGLEIPQGAVEGVAGGPGRHRGAKLDAICDRRRALDGGDDAFDSFAVARIGHALAAPRDRAVAQGDDHHFGFGLGAARDHERRPERPSFDRNGARQGPAAGRSRHVSRPLTWARKR